jgi:hypothetical protein
LIILSFYDNTGMISIVDRWPLAISMLVVSFCGALGLMPVSCDAVEPVQRIVPSGPDTTSHDFVWEEITFGDDHSYLKDVYAISDTDVWAVGQITTRDSQNNLIDHNAVHWNGREWEIIDIPVYLPGTTHSHTYPLVCVYAFSHHDVWFSAGGDVVRWDGRSFCYDFTSNAILKGGVIKMWGHDGNMWFVGNKGFIAYYANGTYSKIESGITYDINDVWGVGDTALCIASDCLYDVSESHVLRLVNGTAEHAYENGLLQAMKCIWFTPGMSTLLAMGGFDLEWNGTTWKRFACPTQWFCMALRGNSSSDIFCAGQHGTLAHYNGISWKSFDSICSQYYYFRGLSCTRNNVWIVGVDDIGHLIILHGRRV